MFQVAGWLFRVTVRVTLLRVRVTDCSISYQYDLTMGVFFEIFRTFSEQLDIIYCKCIFFCEKEVLLSLSNIYFYKVQVSWKLSVFSEFLFTNVIISMNKYVDVAFNLKELQSHSAFLLYFQIRRSLLKN